MTKLSIDYKAINNAIGKAIEPVVIVMNPNTLMAMAQDAESQDLPKLKIEEEGFDEIATYDGIPISVNTVIPFGHVIVK